ncbi:MULTISPECIES: mechanosensitive ion channel family protein [unclassified Bradyrhizobium]|uniref:mechanosensitive ion channel family protein n=1 Tax=unclassified Bradyrhizobium TaxID=2631580 RepID=UPI0024795C38|nr:MULTISPECIES: mechanosensitive ion channel family protein [unclassified Bradyrhizobium]WGS18705.1 mechanosensitive ion channel family protein [Bradyrhizobium sp. ISRA463]WGS25530.1 mechanosensitive ion channel family protein [Bradyrhizobium sp. ISRA464]
MTQVAEWLDHHNINIVTVAGTVVILIAAAIIVLVLSRLLQRWLSYLQGRIQLTNETTLIINRIVVVVLWILTAFAVLNVWGVGLGGIWAVLVSVITVIGVGFLATWAMVSNFTASFFLLLWRPFHFGQTVEILPENLKGRVTERNLMFTTLREESGSVLQIPNNLFFQKMFRVSGRAVASTDGPRKHAGSAPLAPEMDDATRQ